MEAAHAVLCPHLLAQPRATATAILFTFIEVALLHFLWMAGNPMVSFLTSRC